MSTLKGEIFIKNNSKKESKFPVQSHNHITELMNSNDEADLSRSIFYACNVCEGPLIPIANCVFCKRASVRTCAACNGIREIQHHEPCKILVSFASAVLQKYTEEVNV